MKPAWTIIGFLLTAAVFAQQSPPQASMKQLMLDLIHPAANDILLFVNRGGSKDDADWAAIRGSALTLAESGTLLSEHGRARDQGDWAKDAKLLGDAGAAAYQAAQAKDLAGLAAVTDSLDASCTTCHKQYRPNVFPRHGSPREGGSQ
ncbi:MAG TPA: hypothetical protein VMB25_01540 [Bryobacteraceae bacterium]|nr:hypothetical protein [Bryobacteraceae bacterium]